MFQFELGPEFKAGAERLVRPLSPVAEKVSQRVLAGARNVVIGGVMGWGIVVVAGAVLMTSATHDKCCAADAPAVATTSVEPKPIKTPEAAVVATPAPAPTQAAEKSTQRIDMTPTAAIPADPAPKPKHRAHKKKKELDNHN